jgi:hypothetical protein
MDSPKPVLIKKQRLVESYCWLVRGFFFYINKRPLSQTAKLRIHEFSKASDLEFWSDLQEKLEPVVELSVGGTVDIKWWRCSVPGHLDIGRMTMSFVDSIYVLADINWHLADGKYANPTVTVSQMRGDVHRLRRFNPKRRV